ncbi:putative monooxygenase [Jackrogersella minutella]|nr:putative monooxygenase [Jackrogersella minutella]
METPKPFRAIIVGGGLVGLTAAHIFSQADIDFLILEKHDTPLCSRGTTLALWPQTFRIFDQLGLLDTLQQILEQIKKSFVLSTEDARIRMEDGTIGFMERNHGHELRITYRSEMIKFLYETLPEKAKSRILLNKRVRDIEVSEGGIKVVCDDGDTQDGSIVIGADGVRSRVRLLIESLKIGKKPEELPHDRLYPYTTTYRVYFGDIPSLPGLPANTRYEGTGNGISTQLIVGANRAWFGVFEKLDRPTSETTRYTEADKMELVARWGHLYMAPGWTFHDVNAQRTGDTSLINLEEGLSDRLFFKRVVIVGDARRKLESHVGLGYNCGVTDLVVLLNGPRKLLKDIESPSTPDLELLFRAYQATRANETQKEADFSMIRARLLAWPTWKHRALAKYALPYLPLDRIMVNVIVAPLVSSTPVLEWLEEKELPASKVPWKYHPLKQTDEGTIAK